MEKCEILKKRMCTYEVLTSGVNLNSFRNYKYRMLSQNKTRLIKNILRTLNTSSVVYANHYEVLGVTPRCTQNDIKSAYYKLSKLYHPDKSSDVASANKFRAISEAYEVLGNVKLKKMYDKGLLTRESPRAQSQYRPEPEPTDPTLKFYKSRASRHITPTMDGKVPIYDFDAWSRNHYEDVLKKSQYDKEMLKKQRAKKTDTLQSNRQEAIIYLIFALTGLFFALVLRGRSNYDIDITGRQENKQSSTNNKTESS